MNTGYWLRRNIAGLVSVLSIIAPASADEFRLKAVGFADLPGWAQEDHGAALGVLTGACGELTTSGVGFARKAAFSGSRNDWLALCEKAGQIGQSHSAARHFFESQLVPLAIFQTRGQFTGYFEPEVSGSRKQTCTFHVPILSRPDDLVKLSKSANSRLGLSYGRIANGKARPYFSRKEIEEGQLAARGLEIAYLKSWEDLFFMQVQGSGRVKLKEGGTMRLAYAAKTGLSYTSIGKVLIDRGEMTREGMSMQALRGWLEKHPQQARQIMWLNQSYVFFRELKGADSSSGPVGAQKLPLTKLRSLAVDRNYWALGVPLWISTSVFSEGQPVPFNRLMIAQDTGSAIKGPARGDIFMGTGHQAGLDAGAMDQSGSMTALVPRRLAARLLKKYGR